jgi:CBS domain-containing protein
MQGADLAVADLMSDELITCPPEASLGTVASILARTRVHAVFVIDRLGTPLGVLTDFDLLAGEWLADDREGLQTMREITAGELMTSPIESIGAEQPAAEAAARMRDLHLSRLLVTNDYGTAVGVISVSDLVAPLGRAEGGRRVVGDVMSGAIVTCTPETSLQAASRAMCERHSRSIIVIDDRGRAVGVITGNDLLSLYDGEQPSTVADLMTKPITCTPDLPLSDAAEVMINQEVHRLVVADPAHEDGVPMGIVSTSDIVAEMARERSVWQQARR